MPNVQIIPAKKPKLSAQIATPTARRRVAAYARVSTNSEGQKNSYDAQVDYYTNYIKTRQDWDFITVYTDEGISAVNTKRREGFKNMIADALEGKIDLIVTKSVSRFARNTVDSLTTVRSLKEKGVEIYFEEQNIWTLDSKGELLITIMSSLAQEESRSISENVTWGKRKSMADGNIFLPWANFLGYEKGEDGLPKIVPEQAEIIQLIFKQFMLGKTYSAIAKHLTAEGIPSPMNKPKWGLATVRNILQNETYRGSKKLQKTYTTDFLTKKRVKNNGIVPQYYFEGCHDAIIPRELYMQVQEELVRRANLKTAKGGGKRIYSSKYALSSIVFCSECGDIYRRIHWNNRGKKSIVWRCASKLEGKGSDCCSPTIVETDLQNKVLEAINQIISDSSGFIEILESNIATVLGVTFDKDTDEIESRIVDLQEQIVKAANRSENYDKLVEEVFRLREEKQSMQEYNANRQGKRKRIAEMTAFLKEQTGEMTEYDDKLVRQLVERIDVIGEKMAVAFKSGLEIEI